MSEVPLYTICDYIPTPTLMIDSGSGTTRAENAQGSPTQSHITPSILIHEDNIPSQIGMAGRVPERALHPIISIYYYTQ